MAQKRLTVSTAAQRKDSGVNVYVVDTGVRTTHLEFGGRTFAAFNARPFEDGAGDCHGHGTHVAGIVGGVRSGVAKSVTLHSVRVTGCDGTGLVSDLLAGIDWITSNHVRPAVINMSLEGGASEAFNESARAALAAGITFVAAAGNGSVDACSGLVGGVPELIVTGATAADDARMPFSNYGRCLDLFAPGGGVLSAYAGSDEDRATLSGTSMASAHIAGAAALYLQHSPEASPAQVAGAIIGTATAGVIQKAGPASPNRLLYTPPLGESVPPTISAVEPDCVMPHSKTVPPFSVAAASCEPLHDQRVGAAPEPLGEITAAAGTGTFGGSPISYICDPAAAEVLHRLPGGKDPGRDPPDRRGAVDLHRLRRAQRAGHALAGGRAGPSDVRSGTHVNALRDDHPQEQRRVLHSQEERRARDHRSPEIRHLRWAELRLVRLRQPLQPEL